jgi:hypothetical protein
MRLKIVLRDPARPSYPQVTILIDGDDILGRLNGGFIGFDPAQILDSGALLSKDPPRRVAVYRCTCGEAGCGCIAPVIEQIEDRVRWTDISHQWPPDQVRDAIAHRRESRRDQT